MHFAWFSAGNWSCVMRIAPCSPTWCWTSVRATAKCMYQFFCLLASVLVDQCHCASEKRFFM